MKKSLGESRVERAAAQMAWGTAAEQVADRLGVDRETLQKWMRKEEFQKTWEKRFREYVRYLQGPSVALLEKLLWQGDEKAAAAAAASLIKMGDQLQTEEESGMQVNFSMPAPGEAGGESET